MFAAEGAHVVLTDVLESGAAVAARLGESAMFLRHDVAKRRGLARGGQRRLEPVSARLTCLINNAGIFHPNPIGETSAADFDRHYQVNQRGAFLGMKSVLETMKSGGRGSIVNISSLAGLRGYPDMIAYCGTKWAIRGMTKSAARELAPFGIRVNSIHPGLVDTPMMKSGLSAERARAICIGRAARPHGVLRRRCRACGVPRLGQSSYVTGAEITVDGGLVL